MRRFTFDLPVIASVTVAADSLESATATLQTALANCPAKFGEFNGECSLMEDIDAFKHLGMIDGVDCINQYGMRIA